MDTVRTLLWADLRAVKRWFESQTASKIFVALLFFVIFSGITWGLYTTGNIFFRSLATFELYGRLTADYIIHAAIVIILWLSLGSSVAASMGLLLTPGADLKFLLTLPIPKGRIALWIFLKTIFANTLLMIFAFAPIMISYASSFQLVSPGFYLRTSLIFFCIVLLSASIGIGLAIIITRRLNVRPYLLSIGGLLLFFLSMLVLLKLIFPPALSRLYNATSETFAALFPALPLNNPMLPTAWLTGTITGGLGMSTILVVMLTGAVTLISIGFQVSQFIPISLAVLSKQYSGNISATWATRMLHTQHPLILKDWLSITRLASETGYGIFLMSVAVFFFIFLFVGTRGGLRQEAWRIQLVVFSFGWLMFFTTAYALRFLYPLMGREGKNAWHVFTMPLSRKMIVQSKVLLSFFSALIPSAFSLIVWQILPFAEGYRIVLATLSIISIVAVCIEQTLMGALSPDFSPKVTPEKASTNGMGIFTLGVSVFIAVAAGWIIQGMVSGTIGNIAGILLLTVGVVTFIWLLWVAAGDRSRQYEWH